MSSRLPAGHQQEVMLQSVPKSCPSLISCSVQPIVSCAWRLESGTTIKWAHFYENTKKNFIYNPFLKLGNYFVLHVLAVQVSICIVLQKSQTSGFACSSLCQTKCSHFCVIFQNWHHPEWLCRYSVCHAHSMIPISFLVLPGFHNLSQPLVSMVCAIYPVHLSRIWVQYALL